MKKTLIVTLIMAVFFMTAGIASARVYVGFSAHPHHYYGYYAPYYGERVWVPGHWRTIRAPYGWERVWVRGHWVYRP